MVLLDSARGLTADRVHVIYSSRYVGRYDQLLGIQADPSRLSVAYTRGRLATTVWHMQNIGKIGCQNSGTTQPKALLHGPLSNRLRLQLGDMSFCIGGS